MPRFSINLSMLFGEHPFLERFAAAREAGFTCVEYMFPYEHPAQILRDFLEQNGLKQVLLNLPAGDWGAGDRGIAADPARLDEFRQGVDSALEYAAVLDVKRINCLVGKGAEGVSHDEQWQVLVRNLAFAAGRLAEADRILLVEPINTYDIPGFFLNTSRDALDLLDEVAADNLKLQYDVYHMQKMEGNLTDTIRDNLERIGHIQIADVPGRHQPGTGELNYRFLLKELDRMGYDGFVGLEYIPEPDTVSSLGWLQELGFAL
ncbi:MAG: hydroxypyruvate isomerase [Fidelibacterota bacterium]|nr:MAG: hydroxypyruvate isomerase [Candidatus Neomarinimicrobiota bacterium]